MLGKTIIAAATLGLAAPAFADNAQLARSLGVEPEQYTAAELVRLKSARAEDNRFIVNYVLEQADAPSTRSAAAPAFARALDLDTTDYTAAELQLIRRALEENDDFRLKNLLAGAGADISAGTTAAKRQLAYDLGVEPSDYSVRELAVLRAERNAREDD